MTTGEDFNFESLLGFKPNAEPAKADAPDADPKAEPAAAAPAVADPPAGADPFEGIFVSGTDHVDDPTDDPISRIAKALSFTLPEGKDKWEPDAFVAQTQAQIEASKQKLDLSTYDPEIQLLFDFVHNNGGSLAGLMVDPTIKSLNELTLFDPEYFFRLDLGRKYLEQGFTEDEIDNLIETRIGKIEEDDRPEYFKTYQDKSIKEVINPAISNRVKELNAEKQGYRDKLKTMADADKQRVVESMIKTAEQLNDFVGIEITQKSKEAIVSKIKSGDITKEIEKDPGGYQMLGYLVKTLGPNAVNVWKDVVEKQGNSQHYQGVKKALDIVYNSQKGDNPDPARTGLKVNDWSSFRSLVP